MNASSALAKSLSEALVDTNGDVVGVGQMYVEDDADMDQRTTRKMMAPFRLECAEYFCDAYPDIVEIKSRLATGTAQPSSETRWQDMDGYNRHGPSTFSSGERQKLVLSIMKNAGIDLDLLSEGVVRVPVPMANGPRYDDPHAEHGSFRCSAMSGGSAQSGLSVFSIRGDPLRGIDPPEDSPQSLLTYFYYISVR